MTEADIFNLNFVRKAVRKRNFQFNAFYLF